MSNESDPKIQSTVLLKPYVIIFSLIYLGLMIFFQLLITVVGVDLGESSNFAILFGAAFGVVIKFVKDNARPPEKAEKSRLIWLSLLSAFLLSLLDVSVLLIGLGGIEAYNEFAALFEKLPAGMWMAILLLVAITYYCILRLIYGWGARFYFKHAKI